MSIREKIKFVKISNIDENITQNIQNEIPTDCQWQNVKKILIFENNSKYYMTGIHDKSDPAILFGYYLKEERSFLCDKDLGRVYDNKEDPVIK